MTVRILGIGGTLRPNSSCEKALRISLAAAESLGATVSCLAGDALDLPPYDPSNPDRSERSATLVGALRHCDGLIVSSPGYHGCLSGMIKNALDYVEDLRSDARVYLDGVSFGSIVCAAGVQTCGHTLSALRTIGHSLRAWPTPLGVTINTSDSVFGDLGECLNREVQWQLELLGQQVVEFALQRQHAPGVAGNSLPERTIAQ